MIELPPTRPKALGYARVSTGEQGLSLAEQQHRIRSWCEAFDHDLVDIAVDENVSSGVPLAERPNGKRVAKEIEARKPTVDTLVICTLDRLSRNAKGDMEFIDKLTPSGRRRHNLGLVVLDMHLDLSGPFGPFIAKLLLLVGELERMLIAWRTKQALAQLRRSGQRYGEVPYGWDVLEDGNLIINSMEQAILDQMRAWRAEGVNDNQIARRLNDAQIKGKRGGRWQANTVHRILTADARNAAETAASGRTEIA